MSVTVSYCCWLSFALSLSSMDLLHVSHCLLCFLPVSRCLSDPMEVLHVSHCLLWLLAFSHCLSGHMEMLHISLCLL